MSSKQRNERKSQQRNKDNDSLHNVSGIKSHTPSPSKDFLSNERKWSEQKDNDKDESIHIDIDAPSPGNDTYATASSLDTTLLDTTTNSLSDTISIDSNASGQFESLLSGSGYTNDSTLSNNDSLERIVINEGDHDDDTDFDTHTSVYHSANTKNESKTANNNDQSLSEASTITADTTSIKIYDSIAEFDKNLPSTVKLLHTPFGSKVYLVGTAHFSEESQNDVSLVIRNVLPDVVMVELCAARLHMISYDEKTLLEEARDISLAKIRSITKSNGLVNGLFYILMLNMSAKITKDLGMAPGGEFRRAVQEMSRLSRQELHLGDRSINITLQRAFNGLSLWQTIKILFNLLFSNKTITKEEVEQCKQKDLLEELMEQMAGEYPVFRDVFVTERDLYLCHSLTISAAPKSDATGKLHPVTVVGVVGIGHVAGIVKNWGKVDDSQIPDILTIPPPSLSNRIFKFTVKYSLLSLIGFGVYKIVKPRLPTITF